jgi:hypothetical protein
MYIDNKYVTIYNHYDNELPKLFIDFYHLKPNLKLHYKSSHTVSIKIGLFCYFICFEFNWGYVEREMSEHEKYIKMKTNEFFEEFGKDNENNE